MKKKSFTQFVEAFYQKSLNSYKVAQNAWRKAFNLKVGSWVKVLPHDREHIFGWENVWVDAMNKCVGKTYQIERFENSDGVSLKDSGIEVDYSFPFYVLEPSSPAKAVKLNDEYTAQVYKDKVVVGCQTIPWSKIQKMVDEHESLG